VTERKCKDCGIDGTRCLYPDCMPLAMTSPQRLELPPLAVGEILNAAQVIAYARAYATACVLAEREACAERCEQIAAHDLSMQTPRQVAERCAAAIRAR
jgi:hypothetical protein